ncbi:MAG: hypothetical protein FWE80_09900 [Oscillospiraceae bacterium]|nr:hypothetical protein [Oscillospiraceae bacterium]
MNEKILLDLRLFDGEAGDAGADTGAATETGKNQRTGDVRRSPHEPHGQERANHYSRQGRSRDAGGTPHANPKGFAAAPPQGENPGGDSAQAPSRPAGRTSPESDRAGPRDREFERLIKGEYRDAFHRRMQDVIDKRFAQTRGLEARMGRLEPLMRRLGLDPGDIDGLAAAVQRNRSSAPDPAARTRQIFTGWLDQAGQVKALYPGFDLAAEAANPQFTRLLSKGLDLRSAYEVVHRDEILGSAMQITAQKVAKKITDNIRARSGRPGEVGIDGRAGMTTRRGAAGLTKAERAAIANKVNRGEIVTF